MPAAEPTATNPSAVSSDDPASVWQAVLKHADQRPAWSWLKFLQLVTVEADRAVVRPTAGRQREVLNFATEARLAKVAEFISSVVGRRVRMVVESAKPAGVAGDPGAGHEGESAGGGSESNAIDRRKAMTLPLVKRALEVFTDASLVGVRKEEPTQAEPIRADVTDVDENEMTSDMMDEEDV